MDVNVLSCFCFCFCLFLFVCLFLLLTQFIWQLLSIVEVFGSPYERRTITEVLVRVFELMVQFMVAPRLIKFLGYIQMPQVCISTRMHARTRL